MANYPGQQLPAVFRRRKQSRSRVERVFEHPGGEPWPRKKSVQKLRSA